MSTPPFDLLSDPFAQTQFTPEERVLWEQLRAELIIARSNIAQLEERVHVLERQSPDQDFVQTVLHRPDFNREVARMLAFDERYGGVSSVLYFDIENMSEISKVSGRTATDGMIRVLCDALTGNIRRSDILGRLDTNEFGVLLARCDNPSAWRKGESLAANMYEAVNKIEGLGVKPIISYGAYTFKKEDNVGAGLRHAAQTMTKMEPQPG